MLSAGHEAHIPIRGEEGRAPNPSGKGLELGGRRIEPPLLGGAERSPYEGLEVPSYLRGSGRTEADGGCRGLEAPYIACPPFKYPERRGIPLRSGWDLDWLGQGNLNRAKFRILRILKILKYLKLFGEPDNSRLAPERKATK